MSTRRSKRRRKQLIFYASVGSGVFVLLSVIIGTVLAVRLPSTNQSSSQVSAPDMSRLEGLVDVSIPEYDQEDLWWISNNQSAEPETASEILGKLANSKYSRMLISGDVLLRPMKAH